MRFLNDEDLYQEIKAITRGRDVSCAVAFWGSGAANMFCEKSTARRPDDCPEERNIRVICNLMTGSTNPKVISELQLLGVVVRHHETLHAKVYIGPSSAVVASANASANGLGLEEREQAYWVEAGVLLDDPSEPLKWFDALWNDQSKTRPVDQAALCHATKLWKARRAVRPRVSFDAFDPDLEPMPLIGWAREPYEEIDEESINKQGLEVNDTTRKMIDWGQELWAPQDAEELAKAKWVLLWQMDGKGKAVKNESPYWAELTGPVVKAVGRLPGEETFRDVYLGREPASYEGPFDCRDTKFHKIFFELIEKEKFKVLRASERNPEGTGFYNQDALAAMRKFWCEAGRRYRETR